MRRTVAPLLLLLLSLLPPIARGQNEYDVWCFGDGTLLQFNGGVPASGTSALNTLEGSSSIADRNTGALLFYTDGITVYNREHQVMQNGDRLAGSLNSTQSALIVPMPGDSARYYIFTTDAGEYDIPPNGGAAWSLVDMRLDGGRGAVVEKNHPLLLPASEKLTAIRHADGCSYWIVVHGWNDATFHAWLLDDTGLASNAVVSSAGTVHQDIPGRGRGTGTIGYMKGSPDGRRLAAALFTMGGVEIFSFDAASGRVADPIFLPVEGDPYGISFSPDNSKLYVSCQPNNLYQFDLAGTDSSAIAATRTLVANDVDPAIYDRYCALQLGPDGRIYHARIPSRRLGVIANPNASGPACGYTAAGPDIGRRARMGLPNMIESYFASGNLLCGVPFADFTMSDSVICAGECITLTDRSTNGPTAWSWGASGAIPATATVQNPPSVCYDVPGTYSITLTASNDKGSASRTRSIRVMSRGDLRAHIDQGFKGMPGDTMAIPLVLDAPVDAAALSELEIILYYEPRMMKLLEASLRERLLDGWEMVAFDDNREQGRCTVSLVAPSGSSLRGAGALLDFRFFLFLGSVDSASLRFSIGSGTNRCLAGSTEPGSVRLEFCAVRDRLIVVGESGYTLDANRPNPFNPSTVIPFSIGLDGHTSVTIHDAGGRTVATLLERHLDVGAYALTWDAGGFPSGIYYCTITSGDWRRVMPMVLVK